MVTTHFNPGHRPINRSILFAYVIIDNPCVVVLVACLSAPLPWDGCGYSCFIPFEAGKAGPPHNTYNGDSEVGSNIQLFFLVFLIHQSPRMKQITWSSWKIYVLQCCPLAKSSIPVLFYTNYIIWCLPYCLAFAFPVDLVFASFILRVGKRLASEDHKFKKSEITKPQITITYIEIYILREI